MPALLGPLSNVAASVLLGGASTLFYQLHAIAPRRRREPDFLGEGDWTSEVLTPDQEPRYGRFHITNARSDGQPPQEVPSPQICQLPLTLQTHFISRNRMYEPATVKIPPELIRSLCEVRSYFLSNGNGL